MNITKMSKIVVIWTIAILISLTPRTTNAAQLDFTGVVDLILTNESSSVFAPIFTLGTPVQGTIDDPGGEGAIGPVPTSSTSTSIPFTCCIFAGLGGGTANIGLELFDDKVLDTDTASALNFLLGMPSFSAGQVVDIVNLEGDRAVGSGRFEAGLSFIFDSSFYGASSTPNVLDDSASALGSLFFVAEFDTNEEEVFEALGVLTSLGPANISPVPLPSSLPLIFTALVVSGAVVRRRRNRSK